MEPQHCPNGHLVSPGSRFCTECGASIVPIPVPDPATAVDATAIVQGTDNTPERAVPQSIATAPATPVPPPPSGRRPLVHRGWLLAIVAAVLIVTALVAYLANGRDTQAVLPDVSRMTPEEAENTLDDLGLVAVPSTGYYVDIADVPTDSPMWVVADQDPAAGTEVASGTVISLALGTRLEAAVYDCGLEVKVDSLGWDFGPLGPGDELQSNLCILNELGASDQTIFLVEHGNTSADEASWEDGFFTLMWTGGGDTSVSGRILMHPETVPE